MTQKQEGLHPVDSRGLKLIGDNLGEQLINDVLGLQFNQPPIEVVLTPKNRVNLLAKSKGTAFSSVLFTEFSLFSPSLYACLYPETPTIFERVEELIHAWVTEQNPQTSLIVDNLSNRLINLNLDGKTSYLFPDFEGEINAETAFAFLSLQEGLSVLGAIMVLLDRQEVRDQISFKGLKEGFMSELFVSIDYSDGLTVGGADYALPNIVEQTKWMIAFISSVLAEKIDINNSQQDLAYRLSNFERHAKTIGIIFTHKLVRHLASEGHSTSQAFELLAKNPPTTLDELQHPIKHAQHIIS